MKEKSEHIYKLINKIELYSNIEYIYVYFALMFIANSSLEMNFIEIG